MSGNLNCLNNYVVFLPKQDCFPSETRSPELKSSWSLGLLAPAPLASNRFRGANKQMIKKGNRGGAEDK